MLLACAALAAAQPGPPPAVQAAAPPVVDLDAVLVTGRQPGPGLWQVRRGEHVLWILGTVSPLPKRMQWESGEVERVIGQSQQVIAAPTLSLSSDLGVFRSMLLLPSLLKARRNPDDKTLQQVLPADLYARWLPLKARYLGRDGSVEKWRPVFAAQELYEAAMRKSGLSIASVTEPVIARAAKRAKVPIVPVVVEVKVPDAKRALQEFRATSLNDSRCFARTLQVIQGDLETMRQRANAWSEGDLDALSGLPGNDQYRVCVDAVSEAAIARRLGLGDVRGRVRDKWLETAERALAQHRSSFAVLSMQTLQEADGPLDRLRARGYEVIAP
ncbi:TraB/GumN family protein [Xanthomonas sp. NCPPB 2654]|uniref:TraB/GumN family protein n=1 Tax=unclassified Xanthomonas TaxID=2643310 RepID=UPI0021E0A5CB|nr:MULTISPECIES: TraB/GumN family protein [unclassified Xanthomonas]MDL5365557.1 TraB/GumN family protein [Xanthomonas sp. NCPPB 2654]UYC19106.1 TraB/GumN family protein [Xanthomonas sp. CFBP 8443]